MPNSTQDNSQKKTQQTALETDERLSAVEHRLQFIMNTLCTPADWIEDSAATGLYYTLDSITDKIKDIRSTVMAEVKS